MNQVVHMLVSRREPGPDIAINATGEELNKLGRGFSVSFEDSLNQFSVFHSRTGGANRHLAEEYD